MNRWAAFTGVLLLMIAASLVALADNSLCHTVWAGQCETEAQWQAGHCYANQSAEVCDSIYGDVVSSSSDESTGGGTFNFSVRSCGQPLSAMGSWPSAVQMSSATGTNNPNQEYSAGVYWKSDPYGDTTGYTQLYWAKYDDCYEIGANVSVTG